MLRLGGNGKLSVSQPLPRDGTRAVPAAAAQKAPLEAQGPFLRQQEGGGQVWDWFGSDWAMALPKQRALATWSCHTAGGISLACIRGSQQLGGQEHCRTEQAAIAIGAGIEMPRW